MYVACAFICVCAPLVCLVPKDTISGQWTPGIVVIDIGELLCGNVPCLQIELEHLEKVANVFNH